MQKANYIGFDFETGGWTADKNPITQVAMVAIDGDTLKEIERMEFYVKPYDNLIISQKALDATGLKLTDINKGLAKKDAVNTMIAFAKKTSKSNAVQHRPILFAHNADFDEQFMTYIFNSCNKDWKDTFNKRIVCTQQMSKMQTGKNVKLTLGECCKRMGIPLVDAHKAMNDTLAMVELFRKYTMAMRGGTVTETKEETKKKQKPKFKFQF